MVNWYKYWVDVGLSTNYEKYKSFDEEKTDDFLNYDCEEWAINLSAGAYEWYECGFEKVNKPPKKWLEKEIEENNSLIKHRQKLNKLYADVLNEYYLNDKIEKLKNNIN